MKETKISGAQQKLFEIGYLKTDESPVSFESAEESNLSKNPACWMCEGLLEENPLTIQEFTYSIARLNRDQYFKGYTFLVFKHHATELYQLKKREYEGFMAEMVRVADALARVFKPDKMNYELLGNKMPHLHWHLVPRYKSELFWGEPVWSNEHFERRLAYKEYQKLILQIQKQFARNA